jgi:hypothetical protein
MTLVIVVLITVVAVGYLASVMLESKAAGASLDQERAYGMAVIGVHEAMSRVRDALGPWDDPYKNFATNPPAFYWSLSPGRITRWSYTSLTALTNFALFSESADTNYRRAQRWGNQPAGRLGEMGKRIARSYSTRQRYQCDCWPLRVLGR